MFRLIARSLSQGRRTSQGPTLTVRVDSGVACQEAPESRIAAASARAKERIVRPLTEEEQNYELFRVRKNAGANLKLKGKHSIQTSRKNSAPRRSTPSASYDQY